MLPETQVLQVSQPSHVGLICPFANGSLTLDFLEKRASVKQSASGDAEDHSE
ncbi:hypothetical protein RBSWK_01547 [Rhodopirellula baltica SWK14]|uniref:Uncharacterized protein n=1 Tax=Rhodopirellula baltica SWK14 TaxID=993516 RepID=L7CLQ3_RHOBT|nr:hypothetical protein RBSWK_01547 [Rhodopirellula baltica SWK14]